MGLKDWTIRARLYSLVAVAVVGFAAVFLLTSWLAGRYQINGPLYNRLIIRRNAMAEYEPSTLSLVGAEIALSHMLLSKDDEELRRLTDQFYKAERVFNERRAYWR